VGSNAGFTTQCGDSIMRGEGCEVAVSFAFERNDANGDGAIDNNEATGLFVAMGFVPEKIGAAFERVDHNHNGTMTVEEWEAAGNLHSPITESLE